MYLFMVVMCCHDYALVLADGPHGFPYPEWSCHQMVRLSLLSDLVPSNFHMVLRH